MGSPLQAGPFEVEVARGVTTGLPDEIVYRRPTTTADDVPYRCGAPSTTAARQRRTRAARRLVSLQPSRYTI